MALSDYMLICDAMVNLMQPLLEVVIHDIQTQKIIYINGNLSKRQVGDPSLLDKEELRVHGVGLIVYPKINFDGRLAKSISVLLDRMWLLCINADISLFSQMKALGEIFLNISSPDQPKGLFINDWQENLHIAVQAYLQNHHLTFEHLTSRQKKDLVQHLFALGAFQEKRAVDYVAKVLEMGRATIFKYLREWRRR